MAGSSIQFAIATHIMTTLGFHYGKAVTSASLAESVNTDPTFVRKSLSKLAKAGLVVTSRGKNGYCALSRSPDTISLGDIYAASDPAPAFALHRYPIEKTCPISSNIKGCMSVVQQETQQAVQASLSKISLASVVADIQRRQGEARQKPRRQ